MHGKIEEFSQLLGLKMNLIAKIQAVTIFSDNDTIVFDQV